jgi:hypothetical protein
MMSRFFRFNTFHSRHLRREHLPLLAVLATYSASVAVDSQQRYSSTEASKDDKNSKKDETFDITKHWDEVKADWETWFNTSEATTSQNDDAESTPPTSALDKFREAVATAVQGNNSPPPSDKDNYKDMGSSLLQVVHQHMGGQSSTTKIQDIVTQARNMEEQGDVNDTVSLGNLLEIAQLSKKRLESTLIEFMGHADLPVLNPTDIYYFLEHEDATKNPSVKRRKHRFFAGVDVSQVDLLNEQLRLSLLSYSDSLQEIKTSLEENFDCELAFCDMDSTPGQPSHFIAVNKNQKASTIFNSEDSLEVLLVVRGTKTFTDIITDLLMEEEPYRGGYCHKGILESGQYLANKHKHLFKNLMQVSGKKKIKLTLIGHSLGAGAATIAGMELHDLPYLDVQVVGFGCPALLSKELSQQTKNYVTTVVADNDCIPRMSTATMVNAILNISGYDWTSLAKRDIEDAVDEVSSYLPTLFSDYKSSILSTINDSPIRVARNNIPDKRLQPVLFPPGKCVHLYRDGFGISGNEVPCTFFSEIDVNRRMIHDHLVDSGYQLIFLDLMREHHSDHYFQFDIDKKSKSA